jgi:hypothetical protein
MRSSPKWEKKERRAESRAADFRFALDRKGSGEVENGQVQLFGEPRSVAEAGMAKAQGELLTCRPGLPQQR